MKLDHGCGAIASRFPPGFSQHVIDAIPANIAVVDRNSTIVLVNESWRQFGRSNGYGLDDDFGVGWRYLDTCTHATPDIQAIGVGLRGVLSGAAAEYSCVYACHGPAERRWFRLNVRPIEADGAEPWGAVVTHTNVTSHTVDRRALAAEQAKFDAVLSATVAGIVSITGDGTITFANRTAEKMFGYEPGELQGQSVGRLMNAADARRHAGWLRRYLADGVPRIVGVGRTLMAARKDGSAFAIYMNVGEWWSEDERCFTAVIHDMSDRVRADYELRQARNVRALGVIAGQIAHDFSNLLMPIQTLADLSARLLPENSKILPNLKRIGLAAARGKALVDQIMILGRRPSADTRRVDLAELVGEIADLLRSTAPDHVRIETSFDRGASAILGDPTLVHRAVMNLCANALAAFDRAPGTLGLEIGMAKLDTDRTMLGNRLPAGDYVRLTVSDDGPGIDDDLLPIVADPGSTMRGAGEDGGMGLAIVHGIVIAHGGAMAVDSAKDMGATFRVYFPAADRMRTMDF